MTSSEFEPSDTLDHASSEESAAAQTEAHAEVHLEAAPEDAGDEWLRELPEEVVLWLVRSLPTRDLWDWLGDEARGNLRLMMLSGFRAVPANLKQLAVAKKLVKHSTTHLDILRGLVDLWRLGRESLFEAISERDDDALIEILPTLLHTHGGEALLLALASLGRHKGIDALSSLGSDDAKDAPQSATQEQDAESGIATSAPQVLSEEESRLRHLVDEVRERESKLQAGLSATLQRVEKERDKVLLRAREADRALKALQNRVAALEKERDDAKRLLDRTERRGRHLERERDELEADNKKFKRQMRRQQEISEEVRKQLARANLELEELRPTPPANAATPQASVTVKPAAATNSSKGKPRPDVALDREYVLNADGRQVRVTARQVKQRVDANDEEWVFRLIQALEAVSQVDATGHRKFLDALKPLDFYYARVLTTDTLRVLVDASNVVRFEKDHLGKGRLKYLLSMREELRRRDCFPIKLIADASLPYFIDDAQELNAMVARGEVEMSVPGQEADEILAREARRTGAYVVTNDRLFFHKATPDFEPPRITFRIIEGHLIVDEF